MHYNIVSWVFTVSGGWPLAKSIKCQFQPIRGKDLWWATNQRHNKFSKAIKKYITENNIHGVFIGHQGGTDLVAGEKKMLGLIKDTPSISAENLLNKANEPQQMMS